MTVKTRTASAAVEPLFLDRWSPRAFDSSAISQSELETIFDAARWAPSAFNYQPWRFLYAHRDGEDWPAFLNLPLPFNQAWAERASVLIVALSDKLISQATGGEPSPSRSHSFDTGAAWALLALQATRLGYHAHGMTGLDFDRARDELDVPDRFQIEAVIAIGRIADKSILSDALQEREAPSSRKPVAEFATEGRFSG